MMREKQCQKSQKSSNHSYIDNMPVLEIGYYPIRGKAQVPRLIMQYLHISYTDRLFQLNQWDKFKKQQAKQWKFPDLPYLIDKHPSNNQQNFNEPLILTQAFPICIYLIQKFGRTELLGKNQSDKAIIRMYLWTIDTMGSIININCTKKSPGQTLEEFKQNQWKNNVLPRMLKYENYVKSPEVSENGWFLGYLTLLDFSIYELIRYMKMLFPGNQKSLPKLNRIAQDISKLPEILQYQNSERCIKQMDPTTLLKKLKNKMA